MADCNIPQVIISSVSKKDSVNWSIHDLYTGTTTIETKCEHHISPRTLALIGRDYLISGCPGKPVLNVWPLGETKKMRKMIVPGEVTALAASRNGFHVVAAIDKKLHIWEVPTGKLLAVISRHYKRINCLQFTDDGSYFISGGDEGLVTVWQLTEILCNSKGKLEAGDNSFPNEPCFSWLNHTLGVTDIHVGLFGAEGRVATTSLDQTCKLYQISTGQLLFSIYMRTSLKSVTMDSAEFAIYLGSTDGNIYRIQLSSYAACSEFNYTPDDDDVLVYKGHGNSVVCLSVSLDGKILVSGSEDGSIKLWQILGGQCIRTIEQSGLIGNAFVVMTPPVVSHLGEKKYMVPMLQFSAFERKLPEDIDYSNEEDMFKNLVPVYLKDHELKTWDHSSDIDILEGVENRGEIENTKSQMNAEMQTIKETNKQMYFYLIDQLLANI